MKITIRIVRALVLAVLTPGSFTALSLAQEIIIPDPNLNAVVYPDVKGTNPSDGPGDLGRPIRTGL